MTLAVLKASPFGVGDQLTSVEMNILNDEIARAADFVNGGTYTPTASIIVNSASFGLVLTKLDFANTAAIGFGTGVTINGSPTWTGSPVFSGLVSVGAVTIASTGGPGGGGVLTIGSTATLSVVAGATTTFANNPVFSAGHTVDFNGTVHINATGEVVSGALLSIDSGANLSVAGTETVTGTLAVPGVLNVSSGGIATVQTGAGLVVASGGTLNVNAGATVTFGSAVTFNGTSISVASGTGVAMAGVVTPSGAGHIRKRIVRPTGSEADGNVLSIATADIFHLSALPANHTWIITSTGATNGDMMVVSIVGVAGTNTLTLNDDGAGFIDALQRGSSVHDVVFLYFLSGAWHPYVQTVN